VGSHSIPNTMLGGKEHKLLDEVKSDVEFLSSLDAILVLGGGRPSSPAGPPLYVQNRCDIAADIYKEAGDRRPIILCLSAGTAHVPNLPNPPESPGSVGGPPVYESTASAAYILSRHPEVREEDVQVETTSYDTISNAFYSRVSHGDPSGWKRLLVITSSFHMERSRAIFDWVFGAPSGREGAVGAGYEIRYLPAPDVGLTGEEVASRKAREDKSAVNVRTKLAPKYPALSDVLKFLTTQHDLYSAKGLIARSQVLTDGDVGSSVDESVVKSYGGGNIGLGGSGGRHFAWHGLVSNAGILAAVSVAAFFIGKRNGMSSVQGSKLHDKW